MTRNSYVKTYFVLPGDECTSIVLLSPAFVLFFIHFINPLVFIPLPVTLFFYFSGNPIILYRESLFHRRFLYTSYSSLLGRW